MSYIDRIQEDVFFADDENDKVVRHRNDSLYLALNDEVYLPLYMEDDELYFDHKKPILTKPNLDSGKIEQLKRLIAGMTEPVQADLPDNIENMPDQVAQIQQREQQPEPAPVKVTKVRPEPVLPEESENEDDDFDPAVLDFVFNEEKGEPDPEDYADFGTNEKVETEEYNPMAEAEAERDLDEVIFHETVIAKKRVYKVRDPTNLTDLISERHQLTENISLDKLKHLIQCLVANHIKSRRQSPGEKVLQVGLPSWITPIVCSELMEQGDPQHREAFYRNRKPGCETEFDIPYALVPRVDRMITDKEDEPPGTWFQARRDYGINIIHLTDGQCNLATTQAQKLKQYRRPITEYNYQINLDPQLLQSIDAKKAKERSITEDKQQGTRLRCGLAYAHALVEPNAVKSITITKQSRSTNNVLGLAIYEPGNLDSDARIVPVNCTAASQAFRTALDSVITSVLEATLADEVLHKCHNLRPIEQRLRMLNMGLDDLSIQLRTKISQIISANHQVLKYRYCEPCKRYLLNGDADSDTCPVCKEPLKPASWSDLNRQRMLREGAFPQTVNIHPKRASIDYGRLHYLDGLFRHVQSYEDQQVPVHHERPVVESVKLISPYAIQFHDSIFYYRYGDEHYKREDYNNVVAADHRDTLEQHTKAYPDKDWVVQQQKLLQLAYGHRELQIERTNRRLLSGLVIDIIKDIPEVGLVVSYLNKLMETDEDVYLTMLDQFEQMGVVIYDEHYGRYVVSDTNDMIICICHKTYLEHNGFDGMEFFNSNGKCRYCRTTLSHDEQIADPTMLTGREMFAGDNVEVEDDTYVSIETMLNVMLEHINKQIADKGWVITSSEREQLLDSLKDAEGIVLHPYGQHVARQAVDKNSGDLRSFIQLRGQVPIYNRPLKQGQRKSKGYALDKKYSRESTAEESMKINFMTLIYQYLEDTMQSSVDIAALLQPERGSPSKKALERVLRDLSKDIENDYELSIIKNSGLIMSFFTLPILKSQANNMSIILGYIISFLELKYGVKKMYGSTPIYVTDDGNEIIDMIKRDFSLELIHQLANRFSEQMSNRYETTMSVLQRTGLDNKSRIDYFKRMSNMFKHIMPNGKRCFDPKFTDYFEQLFRTKDTRSYEEERLQHVSQTVQKLRNVYSSIYNTREVGEQPMVRERRVAMWYDVAPSNIVGYGYGDTRSISEYDDCRESALQKTYTGYIEDLRDGYRDASEKAREITPITTAAEDDGTHLDTLVTVAYLTQSQKLLEEPEGMAVPEWKQDMINARATYEVEPTNPEVRECAFMPSGYGDIIKKQQIIVDHAFHTTLIPIYKGRYEMGTLVDRSQIPNQYNDDARVKLVNLQMAYENGLEEVEIADLFSDGVNVIDDGRGQARQNYAFGTLPPDSERSIQVTHDERAKKAHEMQRIIKHMSDHAPIPDWMRESDDNGDEVFKPWGSWDDPHYKTDLTIRSIRRIQNLGISLLKILRWLGAPATEMEMDMMHQHIQRVRDSNVIGADGEFKIERDQLDAMGYVLKDLFDIKLDLVKNSDDADVQSMKLAEYESHFIEFYLMSYNDYQRLATELGGDKEEAWDSNTQMRNLVHLAIRTDLIKHTQYIGVKGQVIRDPETRLDPDQVNITGEHHRFITIVAKVLNALIKHGGPEIIDPDRSEIDWLYEERFKEFANKRKVTTARTVKKDTGLNINTIYAGNIHPTGEFLDSLENEFEEEEFDPWVDAVPEDYEPYGYGGDEEDDIPDGERLGDAEADVNMYEGEVEDFDPMDDTL